MRAWKISAIFLVSFTAIAFQNCGQLKSASVDNKTITSIGPDGNPITSNVTSQLTFTPSSGPIGSLIKVVSSNFDLSNITSTSVGGAQALVIASTPTSATLLVMPGSVSGPVQISTAAGNLATASNFIPVASTPITKTQGTPLQGTGYTFVNSISPLQGLSVELSADGNTAIVGCLSDNGGEGGAWIFTRTNGVWSQQGGRLIGNPVVATDRQGTGVAINADGTTAVLASASGGFVFTRNGNVWSQQAMLPYSNPVNSQFTPISMSADGNTIVAYATDGNRVFTRSGSTWSQFGATLPFGFTAISGDGKTIVHTRSTIKVYTRSANGFIQQGQDLNGSAGTGSSTVYHAPSINTDGSIFVVPITGNIPTGTVTAVCDPGACTPPRYYVFIRNGLTWSEEIALTGAAGQQGYSVAISADGNTIAAGSSGFVGAQGIAASAQVFKRTGSTWSQPGTIFTIPGSITQPIRTGVALSADGNTMILPDISLREPGSTTRRLGGAVVFAP